MKIITIAVFTMISIGVFANPRPSNNPPIHRNDPPHHTHHHSNHHSGFWGGFVGGIIGSTIVRPNPAPVIVQPTIVQPTIVQTPVVVTPQSKRIWIEGHYENVIMNGAIVQVWKPGHWEIVR